MTEWKHTLVRYTGEHLFYPPGSWKALWQHAKDLWAGRGGSNLTVSLWHTATGPVRGEVEYDTFAVWNRELSVDEVQTTGSAARSKPLTYWDLNS